MNHTEIEPITINPQFGGAAPVVINPKFKDENIDKSENKPFITHLEDFIQAIPKGLAGALRETTRTVFGEDADTPLSDWIIENTGVMESNTGKISEGIVKFAGFYAGPGKVFAPIKGAGPVGQIAQTTFRGGMTDAFTMGKDDKRLSHTLKGMEWDNALIEYLSSPSESQYEDKFKHFVEGGILGLGLDVAVISTKALFGGYKSLKAALKASGKTDGEIAQELRVLAEQGALAHQNIAETVELLEKQAADALGAEQVAATQAGKELTTEELQEQIEVHGYDNLADADLISFANLDKDLRGARPKFNGESIKFSNDFEKALYIMGNTKNPSKRHDDYLQFALLESGMSREDLLVLSTAMRAEVKAASAQGREVDFSGIVPAGKKKSESVVSEADSGQLGSSAADGANVEDLIDALTAPVKEGTKPPDVTINYEKTSFGNLETDEAKRMIEAGANKSQVQSNDVTKGRATQILKEETPEEIMTKQVDNVAELAEYDVAVRTLLSQAGNTMEVAMKGAKTADDRLEVLLNAPELFIMLRETADVTQEAGTKIARALQSRNIKVDSKAIIKTMKSLTPLLQKAAEARKLAQEGGEVLPLLSKEELAAVEQHMEELISLTTVQIHKLRTPLAKLDPNDTKWAKMWQVLTEIKLAGQLSAFTTQAAAAIGTGIKRVSFKTENYYAYALGAMYKDADRLKWNELRALNATDWKKAIGTLQMMKNMLKSIPDTNIKMEETLQRTSLDGFITKLDEQTSQAAITKEYLLPNSNPDSMMGDFLGGVVDTVGAVNRLPFTMLALQDDVAKRMFYLPHINYKAITEGNKRGLKGADLTNYVSEVNKAFDIFYLKKGNREFEVMKALSQAQKEAVGLEGKVLDDYLLAAKAKVDAKLKLTDEEQILVNKHVNSEWHAEALESGRDMTFQSELKGDSIINRTINLIADGREIHPTAKWILPYYKTVINMTKEVARRTPGIHKFSETMNADMKAGGRRKRMAQAKLIQGMAMYTVGYQLMSEGYITPTSDKDNYQVMKDAGVSEASLQLPWMDKPIPLNRIEPVGTYLLMMAELGKATDQVRRMNIENPEEMADKMGEIAALYSTAFADVFVNKTMMDSVDQFTRALDDPESTYWSHLAVTATVPGSNLIKSFTQEQDDILMEAKTLGEVFSKSLGSKRLRPELNLLGEKQGHIERYYGYRTKLVKDNYVLKELYALGADVKKIPKGFSVSGIPIKLDHKDYYQLQLYVKEADLEGNLLSLFNSPVYRQASLGFDSTSLGTKKWLVKNIVSTVHKTAQALYIQNHRKVIDEYKEGINQKLRDMQNNISESTAKPMQNFFNFQNK